MSGVASVIDRYSWLARIAPVGITYLPVGLLIAAMAPSSEQIVRGLVGGSAVLLLAIVLSHTSRKKAQALQARLFSEWGGPPSVKMLAFTDSTFNVETTKLIHLRLNELQQSLRLPESPDAENLLGTDECATRYESANDFLREHTRDAVKYPLVFAELISYGFRRNLRVQKPVGVLLSIIAMVCTATEVTWHFIDTESIQVMATLAALCSAVLVVAWMVAINDAFVRTAAEDYGRALVRSVLNR
jgi:hypothetical protein